MSERKKVIRLYRKIKSGHHFSTVLGKLSIFKMGSVRYTVIPQLSGYIQGRGIAIYEQHPGMNK